MDKNKCLIVNNLKTYFHSDGGFVRAVDGVSFHIDKAERVGLTGQSGSGKTQTLYSMLGLTRGVPGVVGGEVWFDDENLISGLENYCHLHRNSGHELTIQKDVTAWNKVQEKRFSGVRGKKISIVFQEPMSALDPYFSVQDQLLEVASLGWPTTPKSALRDEVETLLQKMNFANAKSILAKYPHELSGGESQRICLALAILAAPELLLADEPTALLDPISQYEILQLISRFLDESRTAFLLVTHDFALLRAMTQRVIVMFRGKVVEITTANSFEEVDGHHPYTAFLIENQNFYLLDSALATTRGQVLMGNGHKGCCYYDGCSVRRKLSSDGQARCRAEQPPLNDSAEEQQVACWEFERK